MKALLITLMLIVCFCTSTEDPQIFFSKQWIGTIVASNIVPTSWNQSTMTSIETTKGTFVVYGIKSFMKSDTAFIIVDSKDRKYLLTGAGRDTCRVIGF